jgi:hypothetical protein
MAAKVGEAEAAAREQAGAVSASAGVILYKYIYMSINM